MMLAPPLFVRLLTFQIWTPSYPLICAPFALVTDPLSWRLTPVPMSAGLALIRLPLPVLTTVPPQTSAPTVIPEMMPPA
jgi:hypothetical protein